MKSKTRELITIFLMYLVLTIPFYVNSVYATRVVNETITGSDGIKSLSVKGSDGIEGFAKQADTVTFDVKAVINGDTITNEQVVLGSAPGIQFDKCSPSIGNGSECTLRLTSNGTELFETQPFTINLFRDDKTLVDSKSGILIIDKKHPQIELSIPKSKFSSQDTIAIGFDATDFACDDPSCEGRCVGIKKIELFTLDGSFKQSVDVTTEDCNFKSSISIEPKKLSEGKNSIFAKATDKFAQASAEKSVVFGLDTSGPKILPNSFAIIKNGISLSTFSLHKVPVEIAVNISTDDLKQDSVTADLSALNPSQSSLKNAKAICTQVDDNLSTCKWSIEFAPVTAGAKTITINAEDTSGNKENITISKPLALDDKGPVVTSLTTPALRGSEVLARAGGNSVTAVFEEATGLSAENVFLHIGGSKINPAACDKDTSKESSWDCQWSNIDFGSSAKMSIEPDTTDILENPVAETKVTSVTIDGKAPVLNSITISPVGGLVQAFPGIFKIGDKIAVLANITEENDVFAVADFSKFITDANRVAGTCEITQDGEHKDEHICTWQTDSTNLQATDAITFNFSDNAGNSLIVTQQLKTFGLEEAAVPDFWTNSIQCSPSTIDRQLGPLINQRVFCQVNLKPKATTRAVSTVFIGLNECSPDKPIVENSEIFSTEAGSTTPIIKITLKKDEFKIDNATISCSLKIFSKIGSASDITKNPEIENVKINLTFFNLPLGELGDDVQRKIDEAKKDAEGIYKLIGSLNKLVFYAKRICQIIGMIYNIVAVLYFTFLILKGAELTCTIAGGDIIQACTKLYIDAGITGTGAETMRKVADGFKMVNNYFCDYVTCKQTIAWGPAVKDFINSPQSYIGTAGYFISPGQYVGPKTDNKYSVFDYVHDISIGSGGKPRPVSEYMDPQHNLIVAGLFACVPGVIYGLDKYRQIKCLYADCLQNAVGKEGLPVTACEDEKSYATCKYITGELFAVIPYTAIFDHFMKLIKNSLSNPFFALGIAASITCGTFPWIPKDLGKSYTACVGFRLFNLIGDAAQNVKNIIDEGFTIRQDYCSRLKEGKPTAISETEVKTSKKSTPTKEEKKK